MQSRLTHEIYISQQCLANLFVLFHSSLDYKVTDEHKRAQEHQTDAGADQPTWEVVNRSDAIVTSSLSKGTEQAIFTDLNGLDGVESRSGALTWSVCVLATPVAILQLNGCKATRHLDAALLVLANDGASFAPRTIDA